MLRAALILTLVATAAIADAEVLNSSPRGFQIQITRDLEVDANEAYAKLVDDFSQWYDGNHSYSGDAANLSLDLEKHCMLEQLPEGGFVRHMEIVFHQPGKMFRMTGGLGPLQGMGISGAMTFEFNEVEGKSSVTMTYNVSGADHAQLDVIAAPVDQVLSIQLDRFAQHCNGTDDGTP